MVGIERRIHIIGIGCREGFLGTEHRLHIILCAVSVVQNRTDDAFGIRKREVKQRIDPAFIEDRDGPSISPGFSHDIAVRFDLFAGIGEPAHEIHIGFRIAGIVACDRIESEAVCPFVQPEGDDFFDLIAYSFICKIEIRHLGPEACLIVPAGSGKLRIAILLRIGEEIIIRIRADSCVGYTSGRKRAVIGSGFLEPGMPGSGMVYRKIQEYAHSPFVTVLQECFIVFHCSKLRINRTVVLHIVFVIRIGRMDRGQPELIKAKILNVIKLGADPVEIPDPVPVGVTERIDKDLIGGTVMVFPGNRFKILIERSHLHRRNSRLTCVCCLNRASGKHKEHRCTRSNHPFFPSGHHPLTAPDMPST